MARPAVIVALPPGESVYVCAELAEAGFDVIEVSDPLELKRALDSRRDVGLAVLDGEIDDDDVRAYESAIRAASHPIASLTVVSPRALERFAALDTRASDDEYFTRPYSADSIRWRVEAMCIRRETVDDGSGPVLRGGDAGMGGWNARATTVAIFNAKGGVGKTTIATNLASIASDAQGQVGPADRRRHGDRARDDVARASTRSGPSPTHGGTRPKAGRRRTLSASPRPTRPG